MTFTVGIVSFIVANQLFERRTLIELT